MITWIAIFAISFAPSDMCLVDRTDDLGNWLRCGKTISKNIRSLEISAKIVLSQCDGLEGAWDIFVPIWKSKFPAFKDTMVGEERVYQLLGAATLEQLAREMPGGRESCRFGQDDDETHDGGDDSAND